MKKLFLIFILALPFKDLASQSFDLKSIDFEVGDVYVSCPPIFFHFNKYEILPRSEAILDSIANFLLENENLVLEVGYHTDGRGSEHYSRRLDQKRAESIVASLVEKGVSADRLVAKGYGGTQPIVSNSEIQKMESDQQKEEAHATNRRTEFKIIKINR
ncbi:OmpA family protein [Halocola ammonii]